MIAEITVLPIGSGSHLTGPIARIVDLVRQSGLSHEVTALGTLVEGGDDAVWALLRQCHEVALQSAERVVTDIRIDQTRGREGGLREPVARIAEALAADDLEQV